MIITIIIVRLIACGLELLLHKHTLSDLLNFLNELLWILYVDSNFEAIILEINGCWQVSGVASIDWIRLLFVTDYDADAHCKFTSEQCQQCHCQLFHLFS